MIKAKTKHTLEVAGWIAYGAMCGWIAPYDWQAAALAAIGAVIVMELAP